MAISSTLSDSDETENQRDNQTARMDLGGFNVMMDGWPRRLYNTSSACRGLSRCMASVMPLPRLFSRFLIR